MCISNITQSKKRNLFTDLLLYATKLSANVDFFYGGDMHILVKMAGNGLVSDY